jgi:adenosine deaminase
MIDLHCHLGGAVPSAVLWEILCDSGLHTEFATFDQLHRFLTVTKGDIVDLDQFLNRYFHSTELIQSSPYAASTSIYQAVAKAYRRAQIVGMEVRFNPLKRVHGGRHTLGAIIMAAIQGAQRVSMHYHVHTGMIFSMAKEMSLENNWQIVEAAISFKGTSHLSGAHGVVGIDMAGPESLMRDTDPAWLGETSKMVEQAREAGLGITWHVGETSNSGPAGMESVINIIRPQRIGHGIQLIKAESKLRARLCAMLREHKICLEVCPTVNLITGSIKSLAEIAELVRLCVKEEIPFCINTDNPYLVRTNLQREFDIIATELGPDRKILNISREYALQHTFLHGLREVIPAKRVM